MNIGIFDSGLGGLWILKHIRDAMPQYNYIFFGDQANVPYGTKSKKELFICTTIVLSYLYSQKNCACVLLACNTTSSAIYKKLKDWVKQEFPDRELIGIVEPTLKAILYEPVIVFATNRTIESHVYLNNFNIEIALPELASRIENGEETKDYLASFSAVVPKTIEMGVLCCTHYGIVRKHFIEFFPNITKWIYQEEIIPEFLNKYLLANPELEQKLGKENKLEIHVSKENKVFNKWFMKWYGDNINIIKTIEF